MKIGNILSVLLLAILMILLPLFSFPFSNKAQTDNGIVEEKTSQKEIFLVYHPKTGKVESYTPEEYLCGVVAAEMDCNYHNEALKAQTVAAYTLALYKKNIRTKSPDKKINGAHLTADSKVDQAFITVDEMKEKFKDKFDDRYKKLQCIISEVFGQYLTYDGEIANTVYHDTSGGKTESSEVMWGGKYPYLVSVSSVGDLLNPNYLSVVKVEKDDFLKKLNENGLNIENEEQYNTIKIRSSSDAGTVLTVGNIEKTFTGKEFRNMFGLRSSNFDMKTDQNGVTFDVRGYGHGVGMSQFGANVMAQQGSTYQDILKWYYKGCEIKSI